MDKPKPEPIYRTVHIYDQAYHLSGPDLDQLERLAKLVDTRMRAVASKGRTADSLRVAVLAALNLADEVARAQEKLQLLDGSDQNAGVAKASQPAEGDDLRVRAANLNGLLDSILSESKVSESKVSEERLEA